MYALPPRRMCALGCATFARPPTGGHRWQTPRYAVCMSNRSSSNASIYSGRTATATPYGCPSVGRRPFSNVSGPRTRSNRFRPLSRASSAIFGPTVVGSSYCRSQGIRVVAIEKRENRLMVSSRLAQRRHDHDACWCCQSRSSMPARWPLLLSNHLPEMLHQEWASPKARYEVQW